MKRLLLLFALLASAVAIAQSPGTGRVFFYRAKLMTISTRTGDTGPVVIDGRQLRERLRANQFYRADLPPGRHVFRAGDKDRPVVLDVQAGKVYYLRQEIRYGPMFSRSVFEIVDQLSAEEQMKEMGFRELDTTGPDYAK